MGLNAYRRMSTAFFLPIKNHLILFVDVAHDGRVVDGAAEQQLGARGPGEVVHIVQVGPVVAPPKNVL